MQGLAEAERVHAQPFSQIAHSGPVGSVKVHRLDFEDPEASDVRHTLFGVQLSRWSAEQKVKHPGSADD